MTPNPNPSPELREAIARIVDPEAWRKRDSYLAVMTTDSCAQETIDGIALRMVRNSLGKANRIYFQIRTGRLPGTKENEHGPDTDRPEQGSGTSDGRSGLDEDAGRGGGGSGEVSGVPEQVTTWGQRLDAAPDRYAPVQTEPGGNYKLVPVLPEIGADLERAYRLGFLRANNPDGWDEQDDTTHGDALFEGQMIADLKSEYPSEASS